MTATLMMISQQTQQSFAGRQIPDTGEARKRGVVDNRIMNYQGGNSSAEGGAQILPAKQNALSKRQFSA
jgi:hypothetical protein